MLYLVLVSGIVLFIGALFLDGSWQSPYKKRPAGWLGSLPGVIYPIGALLTLLSLALIFGRL